MVDGQRSLTPDLEPADGETGPPDPRHIPAHYNDLGAVLDAAWVCLGIGAANRRSGFHTATIASVRGDGTPSVRTVVLRGFRIQTREIVFHTDFRSHKVGEIGTQPAIAALFYDASKKIQIRVDCMAKIDAGTAASFESWHKSRAMSRVCYAQSLAPGAALNGSGAVDAPPLTADVAYENFAVVSAQIMALDWLYLAAEGHRRARFDWRADALTQTWLAP